MSAQVQNKEFYSKLANFTSELVNLIKTVEMYTENHALSKENVEKCMSALLEFLGWRKETNLIVDEEKMVVDGNIIPSSMVSKTPSLSRFQSIMEEKRLNSLTLDRSVKNEDLLKLARALTTSYAVSAETKDVSTYLENHSVFSIRVDEAPGTAALESPESIL
ncbi:hypothetical protein JW979_06840, partial [bacterium]|nr:hypothetical protein [candidate division CSSED10-310 bacterium]